MANNILSKLTVWIAANTSAFDKSLGHTQNRLGTFTKGLNGLAGTLGLVFGVQQLASFTVHLAKLSGEAEGVRAAFERLPNSTKLMADLKDATGGTVSELGLMKRAVQAANFDISLKALPRLLEFATLRAQQTGQSVDYLVDSIVTGIGRKSKLILDNLGISAVQLTEALGGASAASSSIGDVADAVGKIAEKNLANMAKFSKNASTGMQQLAASWENFKIALGSDEGGAIGETLGLFAKGLEMLNNALKNEKVEVLQKIAEGAEGLKGSFKGLSVQEIVTALNQLRDARKQAAIDKDIDQYHRLNEVIQRGTEQLRKLTQVQKDQVIPSIDEETRSVKDLVAEWDRLNNKKKLNPSDLIAKKTGSDFLFDTGSLTTLAQVGSDVLQGLNKELEVNSNAWAKWQAGVSARAQIVASVMEEHIQKTMRLAEIAETVGGAMGDVFGAIATNQEDLLRTMANATAQIINMFLKQSIAAMIATAMRDPSTPFPFAKIAIAAAGIGAVNALFGKIGSGGGVGGGATSAPGRTPSETQQHSFRIRGYELATLGDKEDYRRSRLG